MNATIETWIPDVISDHITVAPDNLEEEAKHNQWCFSISIEQASTIVVSDIESFISSVIDARSAALTKLGLPHDSMTFYCWFDDLACQLRFSMVSAKYEALPFGAEIFQVPLSDIASAFLKAGQHNGMPWTELRAGEETSGKSCSLAVWSVSIP